MSSRRQPRLVKVEEKKLGREGAAGMWIGKGHIQIDPRLKPQDRLIVLVHEMLHEAAPYLDEDAVDAVSKQVGRVLWRDGWRRNAT